MTLLTRLVALITITALGAIISLYFQANKLSKEALDDAARQKLTAVAANRQAELQRYLMSLEAELNLRTVEPNTARAIEAFSEGFDELSEPQNVLQRNYITANPFDHGARDRLVSVEREGSYYRVHERFHPVFRQWRNASEIYDVYLINTKGDVVYSVDKELDFATNLITGSWRDTGLAQAVKPLLDDPIAGSVAFADFSAYKPSNDEPASFAAVPVFGDEGRFVGIVAIELAVSRINQILQQRNGMGESGEAYLVSQERMMLSDSRFVEHSTILQQRVDTKSVDQAFNFIEGTMITDDYRGVPVYSSHALIHPFGTAINAEVYWALLTEIDVEEVERPSVDLRNNFIFTGTLITLVALAFGIWGALSISKPLTRIKNALALLVKGKEVSIPELGRSDEIGQIAEAAETFRILAQDITNQNEQQQIVADLNRELSGELVFDETPQLCLDFICRRLDISLGSFYMLNSEHGFYHLVATLGVDKRSQIDACFDVNSGIVGQCARERQTIRLSPVPEGFATVKTGIGESSVNELTLLPVVHKEHCIGVFEFGSLTSLSDSQNAALEKIVELLGLVLSNLKANEERVKLLGEAQEQAKVLELSRKELNEANSELTNQTEELKAQTEELRATEEELRAQQEALHTKNIELEQRGLALQESQRNTEAKAQELEQASHYKSEFLANMSHELRTPLNSILILAKDLAENEACHLDEDEMESAKIIHESGSNLLRLINDILDLSKIEAGKLDIHAETFDLNDLSMYLRKVFRPLADDKQIQFNVEHSTDLGMFTSDYHRLIQILTNILSNAVKFTEAGSVTLKFSQTQDKLVAEITDTGIGIEAEKIEHIFGAFNQADGATTRRFGGTGLGLTITKRLIELLGGDITVTSEVGKGSRFVISIANRQGGTNSETVVNKDESITSPQVPISPLNTGNVSMDIVSTQTSQLIEPTPPQGEGVLQVVEDDARLVRILERLLDSMGYQAQFASSAEHALEMIAKTPTRGILLDLGLPGMSGMEMLAKLKSDPELQSIPVYIMSGAEDTGEAKSLGALGFLRKPVTKDAIQMALNSINSVAVEGSRETKPNVLLLEDNELTANDLIKQFKNDVLDLTVLPNGEQGLEQLKQHDWQAVILDIGLEDMNGFEWLDKAKQQAISLPPILVHSARDLTQEEYLKIREITDTIVVKGPNSHQRLREELLSIMDSLDSEKMNVDTQAIANDRMNTQPESNATTVLEPVKAGNRILLVDDDPRNLFALSKVLRGKGYQVTLANSGQKALELMDQNRYDMLLSDIMMPEMDGYELMGRVREKGLTDLPIIALTAKAMPGDLEKCIEAGADDYLSKPVDMDKLMAKFGKWLHS